ncbi:MAG: glucose-6-phosphate isomerase [Proteobacteria bacterium]|nr:MAG: glucose-6-phosphate isomerase [Pseudomonadota bacterium]PIE67015.1 MAG: glucose-6-phosphate isomerase [Deltaproteobacteria bacterium]
MTDYRFYHHPLYKRLTDHATIMSAPDRHLKHLLTQRGRLAAFSRKGGGLYLDFSRQRVDDTALSLLLELADAAGVRDRFSRMASGEKVNQTENRAALHMITRRFSTEPVMMDDRDVQRKIAKTRDQIKNFSESIHGGSLTGSTGKVFRHVVVVGIGGSFLGTEFVASALRAFADKGIELHFLANVDIHNFGHVWSCIEPEESLWIIISKSYTTVETMANEDLVRRYMAAKGLDPNRHLATVTSKGSPGDGGSDQSLETFHMFDFIGGRYSVSSAVGGVPLSLYLGYDRFERFLKGAEEMDQHALSAPPPENLPLLAALLTVWNTSFLGFPQSAIIPYAAPLCKLAPHVQQLNMESNGKSVDISGRAMAEPAGTVIFGEPGTNAQHSFFQMVHQGKTIPIEFIGLLQPQYQMDEGSFNGVGHHQELWANMLAQATALAMGKDSDDPARTFSGNRPSSILVMQDLEPESVGRLLSFYEARTIFEAFIWGINPFDQFGVELGKVTAGAIRSAMAARNDDPDYDFSALDEINRHYLQMLCGGTLPR